MSRRHLTLVVVAVASLVVSACSASPTAPSGPRAGVTRNADGVTAPADSTSFGGWSGSNG